MKTFILDFDGTLADTRGSIVETVRMTLNKLSLPQPSVEKIQAVIGLPLRDTFTQAAGISDESIISQCIEIYRANYNEVSLRTVTLFPEVEATLRKLHSEGYILTVASSKGKEALMKLLAELGISQYVTHVYGEQDVIRKKPAPDMALHIMRQTGTTPEESIVVGDTVFDIQMGKSAGCHTCAVTYGNHSEEKLASAAPEYMISDFSKLINIALK